MKQLIRIAMCLLLVGFGVERAFDGKRLFAAEPKAKASATPDAAELKAKASATPKAAKSKAKASAKTKTPKKSHAPKKASGKKIDAKGALAGAKKALAVMIKAARADKGLDPKIPKNKPFWTATQKLSKQLDRAEKGLAAKNDDFFKAISDARSAEAQMKVDWQLTDSKNKNVIDPAKRVGHALAILRTDFSKEAARKKKGGDLTAKEKEQFAKIRKQQTALLAKVKTLEAKAKKDKGLEHGLKKIQSRANRVVKAPETVDGFIATLYILDEIEGLLYGYDYYVDKEWRNDWVNVAAVTAEWEAVYTEVVTSETYTWSETEESVDINTSEEFAVSEEISAEEIESEENYAENELVDMTEPERDQVAEEEDTDAEVESDDVNDDDSMEDDSDDDGEDFDGDGDDDGGGDEDDGGDDDGGDDDDGGGDDDGGDDDGGDDGE